MRLLWLAVGLRFAVPFGITITLPRPQNAALAQTADTLQSVVQPAALPSAAQPAAALPAAAGPHAAFTVWHLLAVVWAIVAIFLSVRAVYRYIALRRRVALACKMPDGCYGGACVAMPFTLGVFRPRIYMPDSLSGAARDAVRLHETCHIRQGDPLCKPLFYAVCCLHWFNPMVWLAFHEAERSMEAACDEAAVRGKGMQARCAYCESILQFAVQAKSFPGSLAFGAGSAKERITHLLQLRKPNAGILAVCVAAAALCVTACSLRPGIAPAAAVPEMQTEAAPSVAGDTPAAPVPAQDYNPQLPDLAYPDSVRLLCPVPTYKYISRLTDENSSHRGDDLAAAAGADVLAAASGIVLEADYDYTLGYYVRLQHGTAADGAVWETLYAHLQSYAVEAGQQVEQGQVIGAVGSTGMSTGNHLHFEVRRNNAWLEPCYLTAYPSPDAAPLTAEMAAAFAGTVGQTGDNVA